MEELCLLTETAGGEVVGMIRQKSDRINSTYFIGKGKAAELKNCQRGTGCQPGNL